MERGVILDLVVTSQKFSKIYLKKCRGRKRKCIKQFFTTQPNRQYCDSKCRYDSILDSNRKSRIRKKSKYPEHKKRKHSKKKGTVDDRDLLSPITIIGTINPQTPNYNDARFYYVGIYLEKLKKQTFHYPYSKGKQKNHSSNEDDDSPLTKQYQYVTEDDLHYFSTSYLKENGLRCPECGGNQNLVEKAYLICSNHNCGLVIKAPILHSGFKVPDLTPLGKVAATVQDFPLIDFTEKNHKNRKEPKKFGVIKQAHQNAYTKYQIETSNNLNEKTDYDDNDPLNPKYWNKRKKR